MAQRSGPVNLTPPLVSLGLLLLLIPVVVGVFLPWVEFGDNVAKGYDAGGVEIVAIATIAALAIVAHLLRPTEAVALLGIAVLAGGLIVGRSAQIWVSGGEYDLREGLFLTLSGGAALGFGAIGLFTWQNFLPRLGPTASQPSQAAEADTES